MAKTISKSGSPVLAKLLADMNLQGEFPIAILADNQGFPIAWAAEPGQDSDKQSAIVGLVQKTVIQVGSQLGMAQTDEFSLYDTNGQRLVCRPVHINGYEMVLTVMVPYQKRYRRLTNKMITAIRRSWETLHLG